MKVIPIGKRVLVKKDLQETKTKGGIILPTEEGKEKSQGKVVQISPTLEGWKKDTQVLFGKYAGDPLELEGEKYVILHIEDIIAVLTSDT